MNYAKDLFEFLGEDLDIALNILAKFNVPLRVILPINRKNMNYNRTRITKIKQFEGYIEIIAAGFCIIDNK